MIFSGHLLAKPRCVLDIALTAELCKSLMETKAWTKAFILKDLKICGRVYPPWTFTEDAFNSQWDQLLEMKYLDITSNMLKIMETREIIRLIKLCVKRLDTNSTSVRALWVCLSYFGIAPPMQLT